MAEMTGKLQDLLGFDPLKDTTTNGILTAAISELKKEREETAKVKAKETLLKAIDIAQKMNQLKRDFDKEMAKQEKQLGELMRKLNASANGQPVEESETTESN